MEYRMKSNKETFNFKNQIAPFFNYKGDTYYRILGVDNNIIGRYALFFATSEKAHHTLTVDGMNIEPKSWVATNAFRNSLYLDPISQLTNIRSLELMVEYEGAMRIKIMQTQEGKIPQILKEISVYSEEKTQYLINIGSPTDLGDGSRLFWHIDSLANGAVLYDACYVTKTEPKEDCRLLVLLRTFGRTDDVKSILQRFVDAALENPYYASVLDSINFWVLDTTVGCEKQYKAAWQKHLNLKVFVGPNLGGGGNAGHMLRLFEEAYQTSANPPTEVLILDDDLTISMESLARYFMFCAYKQQEVICSLPVIMKSKPTVIWEDGGFWGRENFYKSERTLFPTLLKHDLNLTDNIAHIDLFSALNTCEYSTFIFFGLSVKTLQKLGYPAAFFLRGDDIEFSLRANGLGIPMITNPNLAAWHEPAHSYAQEYMAIMHGIIINLTYSSEDVDFYGRFFEDRLHEHLSIGDEAGLNVYSHILKDITNPESAVLTDNFQDHYIQKLKMFATVKMTKLSESERRRFDDKIREDKMLLIPFVYPGYHPNIYKNFKGVVTMNHSIKTYREIPKLTATEKNKLMSEYIALLSEFVDNFDEIQLRWQNRLQETAKETYWTAIKERYADKTKIIYQNTKAVVEKKEQTEFKSILGQLIKTHRFMSKAQSVFAALSGKTKSLDLSGLPIDFDSDVYLSINPDVKAAGLNAAEHYLKYGMKEGRAYYR